MWMKPVRGNDNDDDDDDDDGPVDTTTPHTKKRRPGDDDTPEHRPTDPTTHTEQESKRHKKKSSTTTGNNNMLQLGRTISEQSVLEQAQYLTTALRHYSLLVASAAVASSNEESTPSPPLHDDDDDEPVTTTILPQHLLDCTTTTTTIPKWPTCIRQVVSMKTLREWKQKSPCIVVICVSARRAVSLLKDELSSFKVRTGKFFPKNGSIQQQQEQLASTVFPIVIGTPHRLRQLSSTTGTAVSSDAKNNKNSNPTTRTLNWEATQLVMIDNYPIPHKQYTVCTLPDTASDCFMLLKEQVVPQLSSSSSSSTITTTTHKRNAKTKKPCRIVLL